MKTLVFLILFVPVYVIPQTDTSLQSLAEEFFTWRAATQPSTGDDILRVERPDGWQPDFSPVALSERSRKYADFRSRLDAMPKADWSRADSIDYLLLRSAVERVNWELNVLRLPYRNPDFYVHQTLGTLYELLLVHSPMTDTHAQNIITRFKSIPMTVDHAKRNLTEPVARFADIALENLHDVRMKLTQTSDALKKVIRKRLHGELDSAIKEAADALEGYAEWIGARKSSMSSEFRVGREAYSYFMKKIALIPYTPEELLLMGDLEWSRSVSFATYEELRNRSIPKAGLFASAAEQIEQSRRDEESIRRFLEEENIMTVPEWVQHYINKKMPAHISPLSYMGVVDDLSSETRLDENGVSYIPDPSQYLSFFRRASAEDPRPIIVHEGIPGHYFQLVRSWANPDPIRRRFIDSGANEGIGFYVEELMLQFGLFDDRPHTREIIYRFMRLRALRVDVDINLALGNYSIEKAGAHLASTVPMDFETAVREARFFAYNPGQAISYQIGKLQILKLIADAKVRQGESFSLRDYHDYMMVNGNVPIALQRWEYLGLTDEVAALWD
ncbi:MAG: DUF885 family protein [Bacteroidota bacterium]